MKKALLFAIMVLVFSVIVGGVALGLSASQGSYRKPGRFLRLDRKSQVPGQVLVKFRPGLSSARRDRAASTVAMHKTGSRHQGGTYLYSLKPGISVQAALKTLRADKNVSAAEPNYLRKTSFAPNDPDMSKQWGLNNTGQIIQGMSGISDSDIDAPEAWNIEMGSSTTVTVAVIDSGADQAHPDLSGKFWTSTDTPGNGIDDNFNGYIDDTRGYNFAGISQYSANIGNYVGRSDTYPLAQSIRGTGEPLTHVGLLVAKYGAPSANIVVSVRSALDGIDLATTTITPSDVTAGYGDVYKQLNEPVSLVDGSTYYLVFRSTGANASNYYGIADNYSGELGYTDDPYKEGNEYWWDGASWIPYPSDDWYFRTNPNANPRDDNGHGTHVAGIIGADTHNLTGGAGTAPGARIMALKAGDSSGSLSSADIIDAIRYAADNGAKVINMSFGGYSFSSIEQDAMDYAAGKGVTLLAAAGNDGSSITEYPAGYANVIGVGATDNQDARASFSNYNATVDISAPGVDIYSTLPTYPAGINSYGYAQSYDFLSGTSMATPMAAGVAALVVAHNPGLTPLEVEQTLKTSSKDLGPVGYDNEFGYGRVNAAVAVGGASGDTTPTAPPEDYLFIREWGGFGTANGLFDTPEDIAVDASGNVYVADTWNDRVQKFNAGGVFLAQWGTAGTGNGQFNNPGGITVDSSGNVYVADTENDRIQKFSSNGSFLAKWGNLGTGNGQFDGPEDVAVDPSGNVYVADTWNDRVQEFTAAGVFVTKWGTYGSGNGQLDLPGGLTVDTTGTVYVADTWNDRIQKFDSSGAFLGKWGTSGAGVGHLSGPQGLAVDSAGSVFVADAWNNRVQKFSSTGDLIAGWGRAGTGDREFYEPEGIAVDSNGKVYVADTWNNRIQKFGLNLDEPGVPPETALATEPPVANGANGWFVTPPSVRLTPNQAATTYYQWDAVGYAVSTETPSWNGGGSRLDIRGDDVGAWYDLPFEFPFAGAQRSRVYLSSNGLMNFTTADTTFLNGSLDLAGKKALAPMWDDLLTNINAGDDVYVSRPTTDTVIFRWQAVTYREHTPTSFAVLLNSDGSAKYLYGSQDGDLTPTIGISLGDSVRYSVLQERGITGAETLDSFVFIPEPASWQSYGSAFQASEGVHSSVYFSVGVDATETVKSRRIRVDSEIPAEVDSIVSTSHVVGSSSDDRSIDMTFRSAVDRVSGIDGYVTSWSKDATESPVAALAQATGQTTETLTSSRLVDGNWYFNVRARDVAGNWSEASHAGPFVIDGAPTTSFSVSPPTPNGSNGWYVTEPTVTLSVDESADIYYSWGPAGQLHPYTGPFSAPTDGAHLLQYYSVDPAGHNELHKSRSLKVDREKPVGSIALNAGAVATATERILVTPSSTDSGSGVSSVALSNDGVAWTWFGATSGSLSWNLPTGDGPRTVYAKFKDAAGNESNVVMTGIFVDKADPQMPSFYSPPLLSDKTSTTKIPLKWHAVDRPGGSGIAYYKVWFLERNNSDYTFKEWRTFDSSTTAALFPGKPGRTYDFRVVAYDWAGNSEMRAGAQTIVPFDDRATRTMQGFRGVITSASSSFYLGTVRYSTKAGESISFTTEAKSIGLIATGGRRSNARIYVDGRYVTTINPTRYSGYHKKMFSSAMMHDRLHTITVVNLATPGRPRFDVDGFVVFR